MTCDDGGDADYHSDNDVVINNNLAVGRQTCLTNRVTLRILSRVSTEMGDPLRLHCIGIQSSHLGQPRLGIQL